MTKRDLGEVIDSICPLLDNSEAIQAFNKVKESYIFAAPEMYAFWWREGQKVLVQYAPPNHRNFLQIRKIWNNEE